MIDFKQLDNRQKVQLIWGGALVAMGLAFFFRIPEIMERISGIGQFESAAPFIRIAFYLMGFFLVGGGANKIIGILRPKGSDEN